MNIRAKLPKGLVSSREQLKTLYDKLDVRVSNNTTKIEKPERRSSNNWGKNVGVVRKVLSMDEPMETENKGE